MSNSEAAERAYVTVWCDHADAQLAAHQARQAAEVDELRTTWNSGFEQQLADSRTTTAAMRADTARYVASISGADDATADVAGTDSDVPAVQPSGTGRRSPQPTQPDPWAAELAEAERIRTMPMDLWAEERQRLVRSDQGMF